MRQFSRSLLASLLAIGGLLSSSLPLLAQIDRAISFIPPDENLGEPSNTGGGGSRGQCLADSKENSPLTILAPQLSESPEKHNWRGGLTSDSSPSLFVYLPETHAKTGDILLLEHREDGTLAERYYQEIVLPDESGILRLSLPVTLEEGKTYEWHFALICDAQDRNGDAIAIGTIERIASTSQPPSRPESASPLARLEYYGREGLWYDFFALLSEEQKRSPQLREVWSMALRREFGQNSPIPQAPFLSCCEAVEREE
ncbi:MAG: DUF928 domain-containing protein [Spirulina sp.]